MDDVSVPPNCQQTVLTIIESSLFLQIISNFEPFSNLFSNLFLNNSVAIFGKFIRDFGKNKTILKRFNFNFNMNFPFHIFWINKYFHYNILIPIQKRKKYSYYFTFYTLVCEQFADSSSMKCGTCSKFES